MVPELWRHCTEDSISQELALLAQAGRELNVELVLDTQRPEIINPSITGQSTELVCFKLMSHEALRAVESSGGIAAWFAPASGSPRCRWGASTRGTA